MRREVHDGWTVRAVGGEVPADVAGRTFAATVPGCIHLDLLAAGVIPDPHLDCNEALVQWVGRVDWRYETTLSWDGAHDGAEIDLVASGLDTVAIVELNGTELARTQNMHRYYRFPVTDLLRPDRNDLAVTFAAGLPSAERASEALGPRPHANAHPFNSIRKMACNYGWDWGADLVTAGIWRPLLLDAWSHARLSAVRPLVEVNGSSGIVRTHVDVQRAPGAAEPELTVEAEVAGLRAVTHLAGDETAALLELSVPDAELWWPHGYGAQPLYPISVGLRSTDQVLDEWHGRIGFRSVTLDTRPDEVGTCFTLAVNGTPVFARGANWIPDDSFPTRVSAEDYAERLTQARDANLNFIRVWGGGIYESDAFYDVCDELGLLVWQDFLFACAAYTEDDPLRSEVIAEAREAVVRLSPHPSLALWNGCNENIWGYQDWGWRDQLGDKSWGWRYYTEILPAIVAELDPSRPYRPGSPFSFRPDRHPNDPDHGTMHIWDVWNEIDYTEYRRYIPRFVAEFGFQAPPTWATLTRAIHDDPLTSHSPGMLLHQKAEDGNGKLDRGLRPHLPVPDDFADWHWAVSLNQARAISTGIEHFRSWSPRCMGAVIWQLNDSWPVTSWSAIDGDGRRKPIWYALRRSFRDQLLTVQPRGGELALVAVNDSGEAWQEVVSVTRRDLDGSVLAHAKIPVQIAPRGTVTVALPGDISRADHPSRQLVVAEAAGHRTYWHFVEDVDSQLAPARLNTTVEQVPDGYRVSVTAATTVRDLSLLADRLAPDAEVDDMLCTLLPGETARFTVRTKERLTAQQLSDPSVLRSANQLVTALAPEVDLR
jgi:beta-mannosidase